MGLDISIWKPMRTKGANRTSLMILSIGLALCLRNLIVFKFGPDIHRYQMPVKEGMAFHNVVITQYQMAVIVVAVILMFAIHYLLKKTTIGKAMRALSDNIDLARVSGIDVDRVIRYTWAIGVGLASAAGILYCRVNSLVT